MAEPRFSIGALIRRIEDVPALSPIYDQVAKLLAEEDTSVSELAKVIQADPALTMRLLRLANAAERARARQVTTVSKAIVVMGFRAVRAAAMSASILGVMRRFTNKSVVPLWRHAYTSACASRLLAVHFASGEPEEAFVLGLVQNIGQIVLQLYAPDQYVRIVAALREPETELVAAEQDVLGTDHQEVGYMLARRWRLPDVLAQTVLHHHAPEEAGDFVPQATIVHLGHVLACALGHDDGVTCMRPLPLSSKSQRSLKLDEEDLSSLMFQTLLETRQFESFFGAARKK